MLRVNNACRHWYMTNPHWEDMLRRNRGKTVKSRRKLALYPGSSQFFNVMSGGRDLAHGATHAYISDIYWEKRDRKTAGLSNLNPVQASTARNVSILATFGVLYLLNCGRAAPSPFHLTSRTWWILPGFLVFLLTSLKNWEEPGYEARWKRKELKNRESWKEGFATTGE